MKTSMTVGRKFAYTSGSLITLTAVLGLVSLLSLSRIDKVVQSITGDSLAGVSSCSKVESEVLNLRVDLYRHVGFTDPKDKAALDIEINALKQKIATDLGEVEKAIVAPEEREINRRIQPALDSYYRLWDELAPISRAGNNVEAFKGLVDGKAIVSAAIEAVQAETDYNRRMGEEYTQEEAATTSSVRWTTWIVMLVSLFGGCVLVFSVVRSVNRVLSQVVTNLSESAEQVASASGQVASGSQSLAQGSSEQAASLQETSASSEEINSMARKNSEDSLSASSLMRQSGQTFEETSQALQQMVHAMGEINTSSQKISKIIKVIDEIAFQTNILALNAAVEAARAGEAGMGFAVVADEVRNLAQRCAQAAKDTAALIEESITRSHDGKVKVDHVAAGIHVMIGQSAQVRKLVEDVNTSSQEQARGIEQVARAITQMETVTQSTAASAEESASAAQELSAQSGALMEIVRQLTALVG